MFSQFREVRVGGTTPRVSAKSAWPVELPVSYQTTAVMRMRSSDAKCQ